jgi:hypothetical protein
VVRGASGELGSAGIHGLVDRPHAQTVPQRSDRFLDELAAHRGELPVGDAGALGAAQQRLVQFPRGDELRAQVD